MAVFICHVIISYVTIWHLRGGNPSGTRYVLRGGIASVSKPKDSQNDPHSLGNILPVLIVIFEMTVLV